MEGRVNELQKDNQRYQAVAMQRKQELDEIRLRLGDEQTDAVREIDNLTREIDRLKKFEQVI
jgi:hypothetical protein